MASNSFSEDFDDFHKILSAKIFHFTYFLLWRLYITKQHYPTTMYIIALNSLVYLKAYHKPEKLRIKSLAKSTLQFLHYNNYRVYIRICLHTYT